MPDGFRSLGEREVWRGHTVWAADATFIAPDGEEFHRDVVHHPGAVSVVPVVGHEVVLVRQFRTAVAGELLEIPAGKRDVDGEAPEVTAARELEEEVGMRAGHLHKLVEFYNSPGFSDEYSYIFLGTDLEPTETTAHGVEEEHMTVETVALDDVPRLIDSGELVDAKSIIGLCLAREALAGNA